MKASLDSLVKALVLPALIKHKDKDVRLLTMTCIMEILRIVAPDAPYSDKELQVRFLKPYHYVELAMKVL